MKQWLGVCATGIAFAFGSIAITLISSLVLHRPNRL